MAQTQTTESDKEAQEQKVKKAEEQKPEKRVQNLGAGVYPNEEKIPNPPDHPTGVSQGDPASGKEANRS